jgi:hypothetical protein
LIETNTISFSMSKAWCINSRGLYFASEEEPVTKPPPWILRGGRERGMGTKERKERARREKEDEQERERKRGRERRGLAA